MGGGQTAGKKVGVLTLIRVWGGERRHPPPRAISLQVADSGSIAPNEATGRSVPRYAAKEAMNRMNVLAFCALAALLGSAALASEPNPEPTSGSPPSVDTPAAAPTAAVAIASAPAEAAPQPAAGDKAPDASAAADAPDADAPDESE